MTKKKKFDRVNGENRICLDCNGEFHTMKPRNRCMKCQYIRQKPYAGKYFKRKEKYPFGPAEQKKRFNRIKRELNNCWDREERQAHYDKQLKEIEENGVMKWIMDRRDKESLDAGRTKRETLIRKELPDTRNWYE